MERIAPAILVVLTVLVLTFTVGGPHSLEHYMSLSEEAQKLRYETERQRAEIFQLRKEIEYVGNSEFALEKTAREELGLSREGEIVYILQ